MAHAVGLVVGHQRRPLARESLADRLELVQLAARCEPGRRGTASAFDQSTPPAIASASTAASTTRLLREGAAAPAERRRAATAGEAIASVLPSTQGELTATKTAQPTHRGRRHRASSSQARRRQAHQTPDDAGRDHERDQT